MEGHWAELSCCLRRFLYVILAWSAIDEFLLRRHVYLIDVTAVCTQSRSEDTTRFELFKEVAPMTVENFRALATGESGRILLYHTSNPQTIKPQHPKVRNPLFRSGACWLSTALQGLCLPQEPCAGPFASRILITLARVLVYQSSLLPW